MDAEISRRDFTRAAAAAAGLSLLGGPGAAAQSAEAPPLRSEFLMDLQLDVAPVQQLGTRRIVPVTGGTFAGPGLSGRAHAGGADWIAVQPDGASELSVRATLETDDGALIAVSYRGLIHVPPGGERYWRTTPVFETGDERYAWLNRIVAVGVGRPVPGKAAYWIYRIL